FTFGVLVLPEILKFETSEFATDETSDSLRKPNLTKLFIIFRRICVRWL
ncbi:7392_t:CDS:2, partial [Dentiscutata heterogama]